MPDDAFLTAASGPRRPLRATPPLQAGWARRTTTIDVVRDDLYGPARIDARGRDCVVDAHGDAAPLDVARLAVEVDANRTITRIAAIDGSRPPRPAQLNELVGATTTGGFRRSVVASLADHAAAGTLWHLFVDDLPGAVLVSGVAPQHAEALAGGGPIADATSEHADIMRVTMSDLCAGWASDATMLTVFDASGRLPVACGPEAPDLDGGDHGPGWHLVDELPPHGVRRRRRLDVSPFDDGGDAVFDVHFRDSHRDADGIERCVHEYVASGLLAAPPGGGGTGGATIAAMSAEARVLPWTECPQAIGSESRLVGLRLDQVRDAVRTGFRGVTTCTHLNDTLRSLADLDRLADLARTPI